MLVIFTRHSLGMMYSAFDGMEEKEEQYREYT